MAPDISYLSLQIGGADVDNTVMNPSARSKIKYDLSKLSDVANKVHVFHAKYDFLLYSSTVRFAGNKNLRDLSMTGQYRNLGNYGSSLTQKPIQPNFHFIDVEDEANRNPAGDLWDYPFRPLKNRFERDIDDMHEPENDYSGVKGRWLRIATHQKLFTDHHRYLFTCKPIVEKVLGILN